jgi:hypothetical protein
MCTVSGRPEQACGIRGALPRLRGRPVGTLVGRASRKTKNNNGVKSVSTPLRAMRSIELPSRRSVIGSRNGGAASTTARQAFKRTRIYRRRTVPRGCSWYSVFREPRPHQAPDRSASQARQRSTDAAPTEPSRAVLSKNLSTTPKLLPPCSAPTRCSR